MRYVGVVLLPFPNILSSNFIHLNKDITFRCCIILLHRIMDLHIKFSGVSLALAAIERAIDNRTCWLKYVKIALAYKQGSRPSVTLIGSRRKKSVCFQCVGVLWGPVLKLVIASLLAPKLCRRLGAGFPPTGHTSARTTSPSLITLTSVLVGTGRPVKVKNTSK